MRNKGTEDSARDVGIDGLDVAPQPAGWQNDKVSDAQRLGLDCALDNEPVHTFHFT